MTSEKKAAFLEESLKRVLPKHLRVSVSSHAHLLDIPGDSGWSALVSTQVACAITFTKEEWENLGPEILEYKVNQALGSLSSVDCAKSV